MTEWTPLKETLTEWIKGRSLWTATYINADEPILFEAYANCEILTLRQEDKKDCEVRVTGYKVYQDGNDLIKQYEITEVSGWQWPY